MSGGRCTSTPVCLACVSSRVSEEWIYDEFDYGNGKEAVKLVARIPMCHCDNCGLDFTDWRGEDLRYEAVCHHFDLLRDERKEHDQ